MRTFDWLESSERATCTAFGDSRLFYSPYLSHYDASEDRASQPPAFAYIRMPLIHEMQSKRSGQENSTVRRLDPISLHKLFHVPTAAAPHMSRFFRPELQSVRPTTLIADVEESEFLNTVTAG